MTGIVTSGFSTAVMYASPNASFSALQNKDLLDIDFGTFPLGSGVQSVGFSIYNIDSMIGSTDTLGLNNIDSIGDVGVLTTTISSFSGLGAGQSLPFQVELSTSIPGSYEASYTVDLIEDPSGLIQQLAIALFAEVTGVPGDFDLDGDDDGTDFLRWQRGFGIPNDATVADGDADSDGDVDEMDLMIWEENFGVWSTPIVAITSVPEPATWISVALALAMLASVGRRRWRLCPV